MCTDPDRMVLFLEIIFFMDLNDDSLVMITVPECFTAFMGEEWRGKLGRLANLQAASLQPFYFTF
jgi:hypothetical protein